MPRREFPRPLLTAVGVLLALAVCALGSGGCSTPTVTRTATGWEFTGWFWPVFGAIWLMTGLAAVIRGRR